MDEQMMILFSTYLDGGSTAEEKRQVEKLIQNDSEARRIFEEMQSWKQTLDTSKPEMVQAPPELKLGVMAQLRQITSGTSQKSNDGSGGGAGQSATTYWVAGTVLVGLLGGMMVLDHQKNNTPKVSQSAEASSQDLSDEIKQEQPQQPHYRGELAMQPSSVSPDLISHAKGNGDVYVSGQGSTSKVGGIVGVDNDDLQSEGINLEVSAKVQLGLEMSTAWEKNKIINVMQAEKLSSSLDLDTCILFIQKNNFHPGLFIAACRDTQTMSPETIATRMRESLNQTSGQDDQLRLKAVIAALGLDKRVLDSWLEILRR